MKSPYRSRSPSYIAFIIAILFVFVLLGASSKCSASAYPSSVSCTITGLNPEMDGQQTLVSEFPAPTFAEVLFNPVSGQGEGITLYPAHNNTVDGQWFLGLHQGDATPGDILAGSSAVFSWDGTTDVPWSFINGSLSWTESVDHGYNFSPVSQPAGFSLSAVPEPCMLTASIVVGALSLRPRQKRRNM